MPSYAILGATGSTGSNILTILLARPDAEVRALVRSRSKLESQLPGPGPVPPRLTIHEGSLSDAALLTTCVAGTRAVFVALGPPGNMPGCTVVQDAARHLVAALRDLLLQQRTSSSPSSARLPRIVMLSSASTDEELCRDEPRLVHGVVLTAFHHIYADVVAAEARLRAEEGWVRCTFVKPGGLVHDVPRGHVLVTDRHQPSFASFADLAAGMVEVADEEDGRWDGRSVSLATRAPARFAWEAPLAVFKGLVNYYIPWSYDYLH